MVGGERKIGSGFSWADEVEREEEEEDDEAGIRTSERQRSNPFGSARPREVVLQEKGIDWRKLDQNLHQSSHSRRETPAEKPLKENNPAFSARAADKKQEICSGRNLPPKPEIRDLESNRRGVSGGFVSPQKPPPRYQTTRNVLACLSEAAYHNSRRFDVEEKEFQYRNQIDVLYKNRIEAERDMMLQEQQKRQFHNSRGLGIEGRIQYDDRFVPHNSLVGWEREYTEFHVGGRRYSGEAPRRPWMEVLNCGRNLGKSVAGEETGDAGTDYNRRKFLKREAPLIPEKRPPSVDHHARNVGFGRRPMNPPSNGSVHASNGAAQHAQWQQRQQLHNNSDCRMVNSARRELYLEKKGKGQFAGGSMENAGDGERAEVQRNTKKKKGANPNTAGNCRKRTMKSGPESNHQEGKRR